MRLCGILDPRLLNKQRMPACACFLKEQTLCPSSLCELVEFARSATAVPTLSHSARRTSVFGNYGFVLSCADGGTGKSAETDAIFGTNATRLGTDLNCPTRAAPSATASARGTHLMAACFREAKAVPSLRVPLAITSAVLDFPKRLRYVCGTDQPKFRATAALESSAETLQFARARI